jgi:hypothetical protein
MGEDKRSFPRSYFDSNLDIKINGELIVSRVIDITVEGISFELESPIKIGVLVEINFKESETIAKNELIAKVIRCQSLESKPQKYTVVATFIEPNDKYLMDVLALIHSEGNI